MPKKYVKKPRIEKEEMERFTLYVPVTLANQLREIGQNNDRSTAFIMRKYAEYCVGCSGANKALEIKM